MLDDTEDADVLTHLLPSISFIQAELDKGRGVIVHCLAGVSAFGVLVLLMCLEFHHPCFRSQYDYRGRVFDVQPETRSSVGIGTYQESSTYRRVCFFFDIKPLPF